MPNNLNIAIRLGKPDDMPFIYSSWLKSYKQSFAAKDITNSVYYYHHHKLIENIVDDGGKVLVACDPTDDQVIYGYFIYTLLPKFAVPCLHYVYVKQPFRGLGVAKAMLTESKIDTSKLSVCTHMSGIGKLAAEKYNFVYNPYIVYPVYDSLEIEARAAEFHGRQDIMKL